MRFVVVIVACAFAAQAWAQSYGGASPGNLLGYRSSAGHYKSSQKTTDKADKKARAAAKKAEAKSREDQANGETAR